MKKEKPLKLNDLLTEVFEKLQENGYPAVEITSGSEASQVLVFNSVEEWKTWQEAQEPETQFTVLSSGGAIEL